VVAGMMMCWFVQALLCVTGTRLRKNRLIN
jgi:hypothetical protein